MGANSLGMGFPVTGISSFFGLTLLGASTLFITSSDILLFTQEFLLVLGEMYLKRDFSSSLVTNDIFQLILHQGVLLQTQIFNFINCNSSNSELIKVSHSGSDSNFKINDGGTEIDTM